MILFILESNPSIIATHVLITDANAPTPILNPKPRSVLVNMSLPIQSVPNGCSNDGA